MQYSVYRFIEEDLKTTPNKFAKSTGSKQSRLSMWKSREKSVGELPIQLLVDLVAESKMTYEQVIHKLMQYEIEYETSK
ncbi:transcriptional regulator [Enterococcus avium]|uniref:transcriptional regulator n=1 Tax=Enterococcus avium TaxID=33945 RepID=UPI001F59F178|nr:transcriptional regulator [Enterococcus avium]